VDDFLQQGVTSTTKSPYVTPLFLVPKHGREFRLVVDYRKVNSKVVFNSYPTPTIEQAFEEFGDAVKFSVLDLNFAYYQITLSMRSRRITPFCTFFVLFEFNKLPMGISVECQDLSRVVDDLFTDLKGKYIFNIMHNILVYSLSLGEHEAHVNEVLKRL
jgi:hypothetical protein